MVNKNEIRKHYYLDQVAIIAPKRGTRPTAFTESMQASNPATCVLCANDEHPLYSIQDENTWLVKSVNNPFGVLSPHQTSAYGYQEVVIESPDHVKNLSELGSARVAHILEVYAERIRALKRHNAIKHVIVFRNSGPHAGATQQHCHSQIYALPFKPPKVMQEIQALQQYKKINQRCAVCDVVKTEISDEVRIISESEHAIALAPFASMSPYETWIIPKNHSTSFCNINKATIKHMATTLWAVAKFLDNKQLDYNYYINDLHNVIGHTYIRITPRFAAPKINGGFEAATDMSVNPISPEDAAKEVRQFMKDLMPSYRYAIAK